VNHYFIKLYFDGYQFNSYSGYFLYYNGMRGWGGVRERYEDAVLVHEAQVLTISVLPYLEKPQNSSW